MTHDKTGGGPAIALEKEAADRIEALEAERDHYVNKLMEACNSYTDMHLRIEELEANLAKAVGALGDISNGEPEWPDNPKKELDWCRNRATTTLALITKDQSDDG